MNDRNIEALPNAGGNVTAESTENGMTTKSSPPSDDADLIRLAEAEFAEQRYFVAARFLQKVKDSSLLQPSHAHILDMAEDCGGVVDELTSEPDVAEPCEDDHNGLAAPGGSGGSQPSRRQKRRGGGLSNGWKKQAELHTHMDTLLYYKVHDSSSAISCRIDSTLDESLLVPLLSVFNESDLYSMWMPSWRHPKLGVRKSQKLKDLGRGHQVIQVVVDMPFPIADRECILHGCAVDDIDLNDRIVIKMRSLEEGDHHHLGCLTVPPAERGLVRVSVDGGIVIRACPPQHPVLRQRREDSSGGRNALLFSVYQRIDANVRLVPMSIINFFTRTVLGRMWHTLVEVATEVRDGKRPDHRAAIQANPELYEWVSGRVDTMLRNVQANSDHGSSR
jgi:hypothetical protein